VPVVPAFVLDMYSEPLEVAVPSPLTSVADPPVAVTLLPLANDMNAPVPDVPLPAVTSIVPPRPAVVGPEPTAMAPLFPELEDPVLKIRQPLVPVEPAFALVTRMFPELVDVPSPVYTINFPPVSEDARPAVTRIGFPAALVPLPAETITTPPHPAVVELDPMKTAPLFPTKLQPELKHSCPLLPASPAFDVEMLT
ncbi:MAG: hypothetical protein AAF649_13400, partial [Verrucomicrobiota bacterium]